MDLKESVGPYSAAATAADEACVTQFSEIVLFTRDTDCSSSTECDSRDLSVEDKEILQQIKQEPDNVCCLFH